MLVDPNNEAQYQLISDIIQNGVIPEELGKIYKNQYLLIKDITQPFKNRHEETDYKIYKILKSNGDKFVDIKEDYELRINNIFIDKKGKGIGPRNPEQSCLFDMLLDKDKTIIYAGGKFGTGKSFILNNYALQELERGNIQRIVYVPNNAYTENTIDIGALPGELLDKVAGQIGPLVDLIGIDHVHSYIQQGKLEVVNMGSIRGRSFDDTIIIVNEAQNLTEEHIKLLIGRCGESSRIFFDGDLKQTDSAIFRNRNGLRLLLELRKSPIYSELFGTIQLKLTERSKTAQASSYLDQITGGI